MFVHVGRSSCRESRPVDAGLEVRVRPQLHQSGDDEVANSTLIGRCVLVRQDHTTAHIERGRPYPYSIDKPAPGPIRLALFVGRAPQTRPLPPLHLLVQHTNNTISPFSISFSHETR
jgi:hypothetical protein